MTKSSLEQLATVTPLSPDSDYHDISSAATTSLAPGLPDFVFGIEDMQSKKAVRFDGGKQQDWTFRMSDGTSYASRLTYSDKDQYRPWLSSRTPWCTDLNGLYTLVDQENARHNSSSIRVGPQQPRLLQAAQNVAASLFGDQHQLAHDAYAQHVILDHFEPGNDNEPSQIIDTGDSRAAMTGFAVQAYAPRFNREVVYSDLTDPCVEHRLSPSVRTNYMAIAKYLGVEAVELVKSVRDYELGQLPTLSKTARFSPAFWLHQVSTGQALFKGEAGTFVDHMPNTSATAVKFYNGSTANHASDWIRRLQPLQRVYTYQREGSHMTLVGWQSQRSTIARVNFVQELLAGALSAAELNAERVVLRIDQKIKKAA